jgi:putative phosphoribosyl transferase
MGGRVYQDRRHAGRMLGEALERFIHSESLIIGIPRGGVLVAAEAARRFGVQAEAVVVRKIESPRQPDSSVGVLAEGGVEIIEPDTARMLGLKESGIRSLIEAHRGPLGRRIRQYGLRTSDLRGRTVIIVDEGMTTGLTMSAAISAVRRRGPDEIIVAIPVASHRAVEAVTRLADQIIALDVPDSFSSVGQWYREYEPVSDPECLAALARAGSPPAVSPQILN